MRLRKRLSALSKQGRSWMRFGNRSNLRHVEAYARRCARTAQQGARANDHGCHDPCSEQHGSRQPRSWLILNVGQKMKRLAAIVTACLVFAACSKWSIDTEWRSGDFRLIAIDAKSQMSLIHED